jgi:CelD/BcsL family acetyltransferase involved in cellulose biosynthesis
MGQASRLDPVRVRVVDSPAEFAALEEDWERLQAEATITSVFETFGWQHLWWQTYGRGQPLKLLLATVGDTLVGILALYVQTEAMLRYPVRLLRFVGTGGDTFPDDLGPVLARGREEEVARALAEAVVGLPGWDVLLLTDLNAACPFTAAMDRGASASRYASLAGRAERIAFLDLPATWDTWLKSLSGDRRYRIRNIRKKLNAAHPARFFVWTDPATLDQGIDRLIHLHRKRWQSVGQAHSFNSPEYIGFHRAVMAECLKRDRLRLYCLELSGQIVAMYYFYRFRNRVYLMQSGFDPDFANVKPGQVLLGYIVEHAIGESDTVLDFLKGDHRYKDELATGERETLYLTAFRPNPGAWAYRARRIHLPALKARGIRLLRQVRPESPKTE